MSFFGTRTQTHHLRMFIYYIAALFDLSWLSVFGGAFYQKRVCLGHKSIKLVAEGRSAILAVRTGCERERREWIPICDRGDTNHTKLWTNLAVPLKTAPLHTNIWGGSPMVLFLPLLQGHRVSDTPFPYKFLILRIQICNCVRIFFQHKLHLLPNWICHPILQMTGVPEIVCASVTISGVSYARAVHTLQHRTTVSYSTQRTLLYSSRHDRPHRWLVSTAHCSAHWASTKNVFDSGSWWWWSVWSRSRRKHVLLKVGFLCLFNVFAAV